MDGSRGRARRARLAHAALVAVIAGVCLVVAPGTAAAAAKVIPIVDCLRENADGTYTAVLGYNNTSKSPVTIPVGEGNKVSPAALDGAQPTTFEPGRRHGAFSLTMSRSELVGGANWYLDGKRAFSGSASGVATCPGSTELPEEGNGTGPAIALLGAGLIGAVAVHRARRRALAGAAGQAAEGRDDA